MSEIGHSARLRHSCGAYAAGFPADLLRGRFYAGWAVGTDIAGAPGMETRTLLPLILFSVLSVLVGCSSKQTERTFQSEPAYILHTVMYQGETLALISLWYTGEVKRWKEILEHNQGLDIHRIKIGQGVKIPRQIVVRIQPMPNPVLQQSLKNAVRARKGEGDYNYPADI